MPLLQVIAILICVGVLLWAFNHWVTMIDPWIKHIINAVVIIAVVLWLLTVFGLLSGISSIKTPHV